ncbi:ABC transporter ATP-binding protein [Streptacidiphilus rugosus]|uniref:ABC transporter ATP-binding protein n=1 Tax=Streptacidiphilus rugosus TaxID=405783 RepID=UPI00055B8A9F|nr:ABC transporter ATP-binding protein [Streptacidiphilus rugosus]
MLETDRLTVDYGSVRALDDVTLRVPRGSITAVLGANGAGKTTLLRTVSGLEHPASGSVTFAGEPIHGRRVEDIARLGLAHLPTGQGIIGELTVAENLRLGELISGDAPGVRRETRDRIFGMFPALRERRSNAASSLSGGERQMLALGRALMTHPRLLLLDEPSLGLAPRAVAQIMNVLRQLQGSSGLTVLLVEQNARSALSIADRVVVLSLGRVVIDEDAAAVVANPRMVERLRHAYLGF